MASTPPAISQHRSGVPDPAAPRQPAPPTPPRAQRRRIQGLVSQRRDAVALLLQVGGLGGEDWEGILLFRDNKVEEICNIPFGISERLEPIVYIEPEVDPLGWFFVVNGQYHCYDMEEDVVVRCEREFGSHHEFLSWDKELSRTEIRRRPSMEEAVAESSSP
ncbi:hypothetical protein DFH09DRAFT_1316651 [Mycena vulgaris]|nr:hypothetical protein DFH09DRAFT_1316651 [Mycena vulgaris]